TGYTMHVKRLTGHKKLVYVILTDRKYRYPKGRSRVVYVGTTKNGFDRVAQSAARSASRPVLRGCWRQQRAPHVRTCGRGCVADVRLWRHHRVPRPAGALDGLKHAQALATVRSRCELYEADTVGSACGRQRSGG